MLVFVFWFLQYTVHKWWQLFSTNDGYPGNIEVILYLCLDYIFPVNIQKNINHCEDFSSFSLYSCRRDVMKYEVFISVFTDWVSDIQYVHSWMSVSCSTMMLYIRFSTMSCCFEFLDVPLLSCWSGEANQSPSWFTQCISTLCAPGQYKSASTSRCLSKSIEWLTWHVLDQWLNYWPFVCHDCFAVISVLISLWALSIVCSADVTKE